MARKIVVIGASAASMAFMAKVRSFDTVSEIICFSGEAVLPYNRCHIASWLTQEKSLEQITLQPEEFFARHAIDLRLGTWVTTIDRQNKQVVTDAGTFSYDILFLGTGTAPIVPQVPGIDGQGVYTFHTLQNAQEIKNQVTHKNRAVVIGAGINGIEAAHALVQIGMAVIVIDQAQQIMPNHVMQDVAQNIFEQAVKAGIGFMLGLSLARIDVDASGVVQGVELSDGAYIFTDLVVVAVGCKVNSALPVSSGLLVEQGSLVVNERLQTSDPAVYAGGDICRTVDMVTAEPVRSATWADAMLAGLCAATQLSEKPRTYPGALGMRDSSFFGRLFYACGKTVRLEGVKTVIRQGVDFNHYFYLDQGLLVGFVLFGKVEQIGQYKQWYSTKRQVTVEDF